MPTSTAPALDHLKSLLAEVADLRHAGDLLEWDERVCMPNGGAAVHGEMLAPLRRRPHEKFTSAAVGEAMGAARNSLHGDETSLDGRLVAVTARDYMKATNVPAEYVAEHAQVVSMAQHAWAQARAE